MRTLAYGIGALALLAAVPAWADGPPAARVDPVVTDYHGTKVTDPYRWMEKRDAEFDAWVKAQDAATRADLAAIPGREQLIKDVTAVSGDAVSSASGQLAGGQFFYLKRPAGADQPKLYVRKGLTGPERLLLDTEGMGKGADTVTISGYIASPDGKLVAYTLSSGGSEEAVLHVLETATGRVLSESIDRARFAGPAWTADSKGFFFNRLAKTAPDAPAVERFMNEKVYHHVVGTPETADTVVFEGATVGGYSVPAAIPGFGTDASSPYVLAVVSDGVSPGLDVYVAKVADVLAGKARWTLIVTRDKGAAPVALKGDVAYFTTFDGAPRFKGVAIDLKTPTWASAKVIVPQQDLVLKQMQVAADGVYAVHGAGSTFTLTRRGFDGSRPVAASLPYEGYVGDLTASTSEPGVAVTDTGWVRPVQWFAWRPGTKGLASLAVTPAFSRDLSPYESHTIFATAKDGTKIPVTVIARKDRKPGGPALVDAYGSYGIAEDPYFNPRLLPWLDRGGLFAEVNVRGGGAYGETWHLAGKLDTKPNTWRDFIAGVEALEAAGLTKPGKVAGTGTSAGGIMIGRTVTERPDLLTAALMNVPMSDVLRFETSEGGPANIAEFGTTTDARQFPAMLAMSPYEHITPGTKYPSILLSGGLNDHRVPIWQPAKLTAKFQAATTGGPVRLRANQAGHGIGSARADRDEETADQYAFILHAMGEAGY